MPGKTILVWFRNDLRLADHPALYHAVEAADRVVPVFVWDPDAEAPWAPGGARRWWLHHSLAALDAGLREKGSRLVLRRGDRVRALVDLAEETGAEAVYWNRRYEPAARVCDGAAAEALRTAGVSLEVFDAALLHDPRTVETVSGGPYHVYTPFRKRLAEVLDVAPPLPVPRMGARLAPPTWPDGADLDALGLLPETDWAGGLRDAWTPGEDGAHARLDAFVDGALIDYADGRDRLGEEGSSHLSPHLHAGELSPRQVWMRVQGWVRNGAMRDAADAFLGEIVWREFSHHMLYHYPRLPDTPLKKKYADFPWRPDDERLDAWRHGRTGYPIVDAGMRELWATGWMHNRARMLTASFLTKHLLQPWQRGARWFWDTLVDADLANNTINWQWVAGCGPDAQPFFRIFNPVSQGRRHDPDGAYVRRWVPELSGLPDRWLHAPWEAPDDVLREADVRLGDTYPHPIVDHAAAREAALDAYEAVKGG